LKSHLQVSQKNMYQFLVNCLVSWFLHTWSADAAAREFSIFFFLFFSFLFSFPTRHTGIQTYIYIYIYIYTWSAHVCLFFLTCFLVLHSVQFDEYGSFLFLPLTVYSSWIILLGTLKMEFNLLTNIQLSHFVSFSLISRNVTWPCLIWGSLCWPSEFHRFQGNTSFLKFIFLTKSQ
jgi:hypothetical protein